jgi:midasin (ATPase involved in ribosome maturation)
LILLWQEALQMANNSLKKPFDSPLADADNQAVKKRKISSKHSALHERWTDFSFRLDQIRAQVERGDKNHG